MLTHLVLISLVCGTFQVEDDRSQLLSIISSGNVENLATLLSEFDSSAEWSINDDHWDINNQPFTDEAEGFKLNNGERKTSKKDKEWSLDDPHWNIDHESPSNKNMARDDFEEIIRKAFIEFRLWKMANKTRDKVEKFRGENSGESSAVSIKSDIDTESHGRVIDFDIPEQRVKDTTNRGRVISYENTETESNSTSSQNGAAPGETSAVVTEDPLESPETDQPEDVLIEKNKNITNNNNPEHDIQENLTHNDTVIEDNHQENVDEISEARKGDKDADENENDTDNINENAHKHGGNDEEMDEKHHGISEEGKMQTGSPAAPTEAMAYRADVETTVGPEEAPKSPRNATQTAIQHNETETSNGANDGKMKEGQEVSDDTDEAGEEGKYAMDHQSNNGNTITIAEELVQQDQNVNVTNNDAIFKLDDHDADNKDMERNRTEISNDEGKAGHKDPVFEKENSDFINISNTKVDHREHKTDVEEMHEKHEKTAEVEDESNLLIEGNFNEDEEEVKGQENLPRIIAVDAPKQEPEMNVLLEAKSSGRYKIPQDREVLLMDPKGNEISVKIPLFRSSVLSQRRHSFTFHLSHGPINGIQSWVMAIVKLKKDRFGKTLFLKGPPEEYEGKLKEYSDGPEYGEPYITAGFSAQELPYEFTVGDGKMYGGYKNGELQFDESYGVFMLGTVHGLFEGLIYVESEWLVDSHCPDVPTYFHTNSDKSKFFLPLFLSCLSLIAVIATCCHLWKEGKLRLCTIFASKVRSVARRKSRYYGYRHLDYFSDNRRNTRSFKEKELKHFYRDANSNEAGAGSSNDPEHDPYSGYRNNQRELPTLKKTPFLKGRKSTPNEFLRKFMKGND